jgi:hypothetical protein
VKTSVKVVTVTIVFAVLAFLSNTVGPLGGFWRPAAEAPDPQGIQRALFAFLLAVEAIALGVGISFLFYGFPLVRAVSRASAGLTRAAQFAIAWLLVNWWGHDSLHMHVGMHNVNALLGIEYGFHFTLILSGLILLSFLWVGWRNQTGTAPGSVVH